jgi:hypothetical protein
MPLRLEGENLRRYLACECGEVKQADEREGGRYSLFCV